MIQKTPFLAGTVGILFLFGVPLLAVADNFREMQAFRNHLPRTEAEQSRITAILSLADRLHPLAYEENAAGQGTYHGAPDRQVFDQPLGGIAGEARLDMIGGAALFDRLWVSSPASTLASDGLGPLFNARSCAACHMNAGRGGPIAGRVVRVSGTDGGPHPEIGLQLQDRSMAGVLPEGQLTLDWAEHSVTLADGDIVTLRRPLPRIDGQPPGFSVSLRQAPPLIGLGLIEAIRPEDITSLADPEDADGDGISGRLALVPSAHHGGILPGRFGWKAAMPTLVDQTADAFFTDMGLSSPARPQDWGDCTQTQTACRAGPHGGDPEHGGVEIGPDAMQLVTAYLHGLSVPARRDHDAPQVAAGRAVFMQTGCSACHRPAYVTARQAGGGPTSFQLIWPWSDFLLHDMGEALADGRQEGAATGREWRTAPLWGLGLTDTVSGDWRLLHDGRAGSILEAILWHGGEAAPTRDAVIALPTEDRVALIEFLESL